ncbi:branched-chain amino acid ABC transporter permease [Geodermatophilus sp. CPCC 205506]|uniref:branched-chain amino acid ABC transporter permease n=1 Tax=Geodermatophilus sp. CPCC 205506 TaxID=2936596 RepID=UPI003EF06C13
MAVLALALAVVLALTWQSRPDLDLVLVVCTTGLVAVSLGLVYGQAGILSVAQGAFAAVGAYATAIVTTQWELPLWLGLVAALVVPAVLAFVLARVIVRLSTMALAVATLLLAEVIGHAIAAGGELTGGFIGIAGIDSWEFMSDRAGAAVTGAVLLVLAVLVVSHLVHSQQGRALRVVATDTTLARSLGIDVTTRLSVVFALGGAIAGSAGWLYASTRSFLAPDSFPVLLSLEVVMMVIIGGKRTVLGPVLGTAVLVVVLDLVPASELRGVFYGALLVVALMLFPNGVLGSDWRSAGRRLRRSGAAGDDARPAVVQERSEAAAARTGSPA